MGRGRIRGDCKKSCHVVGDQAGVAKLVCVEHAKPDAQQRLRQVVHGHFEFIVASASLCSYLLGFKVGFGPQREAGCCARAAWRARTFMGEIWRVEAGGLPVHFCRLDCVWRGMGALRGAPSAPFLPRDPSVGGTFQSGGLPLRPSPLAVARHAATRFGSTPAPKQHHVLLVLSSSASQLLVTGWWGGGLPWLIKGLAPV